MCKMHLLHTKGGTMSLTKQELYSQYEALAQTYDYVVAQKEKIETFFTTSQCTKILFLGSGSGACLCQSAKYDFQMNTTYTADYVTAGDMFLNFDAYKNMIDAKTLIITMSRSGSTSEVVGAITKAKKYANVKVLSIAATCGSLLSELADLTLELPWIFDNSVCQTRCVTNLYATTLLVRGVMQKNTTLLAEIKQAIAGGASCMQIYDQSLITFAKKKVWDHVVVLGDAEVSGLAHEASIAFMEIAQTQANFHNILDFRHGPMVLLNDSSLVIMLANNQSPQLQQDLIKEIQGCGSDVVVVSSLQDIKGDLTVALEKYTHFAVLGILFMFVPQVIALEQAALKGVNPDEPAGLKPWIQLDTGEV